MSGIRARYFFKTLHTYLCMEEELPQLPKVQIVGLLESKQKNWAILTKYVDV